MPIDGRPFDWAGGHGFAIVAASASAPTLIKIGGSSGGGRCMPPQRRGEANDELSVMRFSTTKPTVALLVASLSFATAAQTPLPPDVHPVSRNRLPPRDSGPASGVAAIVAQGSGNIVRWEFALGRPLSELAILTVARELDQPYEWSLHEIEALAVGLDPEIIDVVRNRLPLDSLDPAARVIIELGRALVGEHRVSSDTYAQAQALLGTTNLVDIVMLMGEYVEDGIRLTVFNQHMPPGWPQFLPLPFDLPDDIHADSRSRLPYLRRETRSAGPTPSLYGRGLAPEGTGPGQITRRSRGVDVLESQVGAPLILLARLVAARELDDDFQWAENEAIAGEVGLQPEVIDVVRRGESPSKLAVPERVLIELGRELFGNHFVRPATYADALAQFGEANLVGFVNVVAKSASDAAILIAFDQHPPAGQP